MSQAGELIGLDIGQKRTGLARASKLAGLAEPLQTVETSDLAKTLKQLSQETGINAVVVGLPRSLEGRETAQTTWVRQVVDELKKQIDWPFYWQDEALSSRCATAQLAQKPKTKNQIDEHALAAAIILQDFIDTPEAVRIAI